jgi:hypothetical protein
MITYLQLRKLRPGGTMDSLALASICAAGMISGPFFGPSLPLIPAYIIAIGLATAGASWLVFRFIKATSNISYFKTEFNINSAETPFKFTGSRRSDGIMLGYCVDSGEPLFIPYENLMRHFFILGQSGVGKTVLGEFMMSQHIMNGGGMMMIDGKMDSKNLQAIYTYAKWAGREDDLYIINPGNPDMSNTYNPILKGDPDEVSDRILLLIPSTENSPGADHYKQEASQGLTTLIGALQKSKLTYTFIDLSILMTNAQALLHLETLIPDSEERVNYAIFLDKFKIIDKDGNSNIDIKRLKETFGGIGGRLFSFGTGKFGQVTNHTSPDVEMYEAMKNNKLVYVALPTMGKDNAARNFGQMVVGDMRTAISWLQGLPQEEKPWPPFLGFFDEAGSYVNDSWNRMFEQSRSAHIILCPAIQTLANFDAISPELQEMTIGNTWTKTFFKLGTEDSAERIADLIGLEHRILLGLSETTGSGASSVSNDVSLSNGLSDNSGTGFTEKESEEYKVSKEQLKALNIGEAIVVYGGSKVYHIKIPFISPSKELIEKVGKVDLNRHRIRWSNAIGLFKQADRFVSTTRQSKNKGKDKNKDD